MSRKCQVTGKRALVGNNVSHSHNKTKRRFQPNLQTKKIWIPEEKRFVKVRLTTKALRTLDKQGHGGLMKELKKLAKK